MITKRNNLSIPLSRKAVLIGCLDVLCICIAYFAALWLRYDFQFNDIAPAFVDTYTRVILPWCGICIVVFSLFGLYSSIWSFVSTDELIRIVQSYGVLAVVSILLGWVLELEMARSVYVVGLVLSCICTVGLWFSYRMLRYVRHHLAELSETIS